MHGKNFEAANGLLHGRFFIRGLLAASVKG
jgi:hypothetical protein